MTRARQITLPGVNYPLPVPPVRAKRDLSEEAFLRALRRNRFVRCAGLLMFVDVSTPPGEFIAADACVVYRRDPLRVDRRATLAKLLKARKEIVK